LATLMNTANQDCSCGSELVHPRPLQRHVSYVSTHYGS